MPSQEVCVGKSNLQSDQKAVIVCDQLPLTLVKSVLSTIST